MTNTKHDFKFFGGVLVSSADHVVQVACYGATQHECQHVEPVDKSDCTLILAFCRCVLKRAGHTVVPDYNQAKEYRFQDAL